MLGKLTNILLIISWDKQLRIYNIQWSEWFYGIKSNSHFFFMATLCAFLLQKSSILFDSQRVAVLWVLNCCSEGNICVPYHCFYRQNIILFGKEELLELSWLSWTQTRMRIMKETVSEKWKLDPFDSRKEVKKDWWRGKTLVR